MRVWFEQEIPVADSPPGITLTLQGIINPVSTTLPLIEIELIESHDDEDTADEVKKLYHHNPTIGHHDFSLDDVLVKYSPKIQKWLEKLKQLSYDDIHKL